MKRNLLTLCILCLMLTPALAHPPKKGTCEIDAENSLLKATFPHDVDDVTSHYIDYVNFTFERTRIDPESGKKKKTKTELRLEYTSQTSPKDHVIQMPVVDIQPGDRIVMKAHCSKFGWKTTKYTVPEPKADEAKDQTED